MRKDWGHCSRARGVWVGGPPGSRRMHKAMTVQWAAVGGFPTAFGVQATAVGRPQPAAGALDCHHDRARRHWTGSPMRLVPSEPRQRPPFPLPTVEPLPPPSSTTRFVKVHRRAAHSASHFRRAFLQERCAQGLCRAPWPVAGGLHGEGARGVPCSAGGLAPTRATQRRVNRVTRALCSASGGGELRSAVFRNSSQCRNFSHFFANSAIFPQLRAPLCGVPAIWDPCHPSGVRALTCEAGMDVTVT